MEVNYEGKRQTTKGKKQKIEFAQEVKISVPGGKRKEAHILTMLAENVNIDFTANVRRVSEEGETRFQGIIMRKESKEYTGGHRIFFFFFWFQRVIMKCGDH